MRRRNICSLVNSFVVINQSLWAKEKAKIITIVIVAPANLVAKLPIGPFTNPPIIKINPAPNSEIATNEAKDDPRKLDKPCGGNGNLPKPCKAKAIPNPNLISHGAKNSKLEKILYLWPKQHAWGGF